MVHEHLDELLTLQLEALRWFGRRDRGRPRFVVEQGHLSEGPAWLDSRYLTLASTGHADGDADLAAQHHEERAAGFILMNDRCSGAVHPPRADLLQDRELLQVEVAKQLDVRQK